MTSGKQIAVRTAPARQHPKKIQSTAGVPTSSDNALNARAEMIAPALPHAAEIPCAKAR